MLRHRITSWLDRVGALQALRRRRRAGGELSVITYHRVADPSPDYPFYEGVIDARPAELAAQLKWLREHCSVIDLDTLREAVVENRPLPPNAVLVTFDDGYADNRHCALPLLCQHGIKATFFIPTDFVSERRLFWWDRIGYVLNRTSKPRITLEYPCLLRFEMPRERARALLVLGTLIKEMQGIDVDKLLDELTAAAEVPWSTALERELADEQLMKWHEVRELRDAGMSVQSHTRTHRTVHTLPTDELTEELVGSRRELEQRLGAGVYALAYPVGRHASALSTIGEAVAAAGYELAFTNATGPALIGRDDRLWIPRIPMEPDIPPSHFRALIGLPSLARSFYG